MRRYEGYYGIIQYFPEPDLLEGVNVGVYLACKSLNSFDVLMSATNTRVAHRFGQYSYDDRTLSEDKEALRQRLLDTAPMSPEEIQSFASKEAGNLLLTPPQSIAVANMEEDMKTLYESLVPNVRSVKPKHRHIEKRARLIEATVALLESAPLKRMQITNLNKALFYLDLYAMRDTGKPVTRNVYLAMERGPVMHQYKEKLVGDLSKLGYIRKDRGPDGEMPIVLVKPLSSYRFLNDDHLRSLAEQTSKFITKMSAKSASIFSHRNPGWSIAYALGAKRSAAPRHIDMNIAMQEILDHDPWLDEGEDDAVRAAFSADSSSLEEW